MERENSKIDFVHRIILTLVITTARGKDLKQIADYVSFYASKKRGLYYP